VALVQPDLVGRYRRGGHVRPTPGFAREGFDAALYGLCANDAVHRWVGGRERVCPLYGCPVGLSGAPAWYEQPDRLQQRWELGRRQLLPLDAGGDRSAHDRGCAGGGII